MNYLKKLLARTIVLAPLLIASPPAPATILFAGGEDIDLSPAASCSFCSITTNVAHFRAAYARLALQLNSVNAADPNPFRWQSPTFTSSSSFWLHGQYYSNVNTSTNAAQAIIVYATDGNPAILVRGTGTAGTVKISKRSTAGVFTDLVTCTAGVMPANGARQQIDLDIQYNVAGSVTLYKDGTSICNYTGDVTTDGRTLLNQFAVGALTNSVDAWSEMIVADVDTRAKSLLRMTPNANGNAVTWSGTNPCTVILPATTYNDTSYVSSGTNNQLEQCTVTNTFPAGTWRIDGLAMSARALRGGTGPQHFQFVTRTGGADFTSADQNPGPAFANHPFYFQPLNPGTAAAWTQSELTAAGFNIGLKSTP